MAHLARSLVSRVPSAIGHPSRSLSTSTIARAAAAAAVQPSSDSSTSAASRSTPASARKTFPARRPGYGKTTGSVTGSSAATVKPRGPPRLVPKTNDEVSSFPTPQPLADIPDYANLAPPIFSTEVEDHPSGPSSSSRPVIASTITSGQPPHPIAAELSPLTATSNKVPTSTPQTPPPFSANAPTPSTAIGYNDWTTSFHGLSIAPFEKHVAEVLMRPLRVADVEVKPDGLLYLPEIKYRRTLNEAFGPGGWGLAPRSETEVGPRNVSREWGLVCLGRLVAIARGEQEYFDPSGVPTATEACKSNALMRCCKDLGIASELWDPAFIREFKRKHCTEAFVEHVVQKKKRKLWRKNDAKFEYPYKEG